MEYDYKKLFAEIRAQADPEDAVLMKRYMRDQFEYLGVKTPIRRLQERAFLKVARKSDAIDWNFIDACWEAEEREFQYLALDYIGAVSKHLTASDIPKLKHLIVTKSWWDTVDGLDTIVGDVALRFPKINRTLLAWSKDKNFWLRRIAIDHQLNRKAKTDASLLTEIIENNLGSDEFFINKAIGWALREYRKTNPDFVHAFVETHKDQMAALSIKEATRPVKKPKEQK